MKTDPDLDRAYAEAEPAKEFKPSIYQQGVFDHVEDPDAGNAVVEAVAGSGKTTTILEALRRCRGRVAFFAFNKHIADELRTRAPGSAEISTIHSLGLRSLRKTFGHLSVDADKMRGILKTVMGEEYWTPALRGAVLQLARLAKLTLTPHDSEKALVDLLVSYDLDEEEVEENLDEVVEWTMDALREDIARTSVVDFDDMVWFPNVLKVSVQKYQWTFIDEAQDLNAAQRQLVMKALGKNGRAAAVGDSRQAIYGFAGADVESVRRLTRDLSAKTLPLSICYRCPTSHLDLAREIVPHIEAAPDAKEGRIERLSLSDGIGRMRPGDLVLCRINAPLATIAMRLIRQGRKAVIRGRDLSSGLVALARKMGTDDIYEFHARLIEYRDKQSAKWLKAEKERKAQSLHDKTETLIALSEGVGTVSELVSRIESVFSDRQEGIVLSSVHRAKGIEADRVFIHREDLMPLPKSRDLEQEMNLKYVALTRSKSDLFFTE